MFSLSLSLSHIHANVYFISIYMIVYISSLQYMNIKYFIIQVYNLFISNFIPEAYNIFFIPHDINSLIPS